ncbi:hypothetical protein PVAND_016099 [Polypedilum vanderplanki]|uniref:Peptidase C1A papain C-terminal domain-containing protein n=1 Tax=Polypedilum vanderplanki TaxID=319348 RepID=A0A9J6BF79_POLVA|nr:hypothetical protein PVAND_016099 [Polypedilum vanderplanki]
MREEITVLTMMFLFCAATIPIIVISSASKNFVIRNYSVSDQKLSYQFYQMNFRDRSAMNIVRIIESRKNSSKYQGVDLKIFQNIDSDHFFEKYQKIIPNQKYLSYFSKENIEKIWMKFNFYNKTLLKSNGILIPLKVDWRKIGIISEVKKQTKCGDCWNIATIGLIESMLALKTGKLEELSTTQILQCNDEGMDCKGGDFYRLLRWLYEDKIYIKTEKEFIESNYNCKRRKPGIRVKDFSFNNFTGNEHLMLLHLARQGPLVTAVNSLMWKEYTNKVIEKNCNGNSKLINHAVEIVGYDMTANTPYYIVKNSWGSQWGINGYIHIAIGDNLCGIAERVSSVIV